MVPVLVAAAVGAAIGLLRRPYGAHLAPPRLVLPAVALVAVGLQVTLGWFDPDVQGMVLGFSLALLTGFGLVNLHVVGMGVLTIGLALNMAVVLIHGAMPVRVEALVESGAVEADELADTDPGAGRRFERDDDVVPVLGDAIPVSVFGAAMSFGDLIVLAGIGSVTGDLTRHARRRSARSVLRRLRRLEPERGVELRVDFEALGLPEHGEDVEELPTIVDLVEAEDRLRDERRDEGDRRERAGVTTLR